MSVLCVNCRLERECMVHKCMHYKDTIKFLVRSKTNMRPSQITKYGQDVKIQNGQI